MLAGGCTNHVQDCHLLKDLEDDSLNEFLSVVEGLLFEEVHHVSCIGLVLHKYYSIAGLENFNERRDVVGLEVVQISDFVFHQLYSCVMQRRTSRFLLHLSLVVYLEGHDLLAEDVLALADDAEVATPQNLLGSVMFLEVGEDAERRNHRIEVDEEFFVGGVQLGGGSLMGELNGEDF